MSDSPDGGGDPAKPDNPEQASSKNDKKENDSPKEDDEDVLGIPEEVPSSDSDEEGVSDSDDSDSDDSDMSDHSEEVSSDSDDSDMSDHSEEVSSDSDDSDMSDNPEVSSDSDDEVDSDSSEKIVPDLPEKRGVSNLQDLSLEAVIKLLKTRDEVFPVSMLEPLTAEMKSDILIKIDQSWGSGALMDRLLSSLEYVLPALSVTSKRIEMLAAFQTPILCQGSKFISSLTKSVDDKLKQLDAAEAALHFPQIVALASILLDSAWPNFAEVVLYNMLACSDEASSDDIVIVGARLLLLNSMTTQLKLTEAGEQVDKLGGLRILSDDSIDDIRSTQLRATFNMECCRFHLEKSDFKLAYSEAMVALKCLREEHPVRLVVDVYMMAGRACSMRRKFDIAKILVCEAFLLARGKLGPKSVTYAEAFAGIGFYWQSIENSFALEAYEKALRIIQNIFHGENYHEVRIRELMAQMDMDRYTGDLGWFHNLNTSDEEEEEDDDKEEVYYGYDEYDNTMYFWDKLRYIRSNHLVDNDHHPLAANGQRMDAIFALKRCYKVACRRMLKLYWRRGSALGAEELQDLNTKVEGIGEELLSSLEDAEKTFGGNSLQTARHLDSLGFFYLQTQKFSLAESTLKRALAMKEAVLDPDDREVNATLLQLGVVRIMAKRSSQAKATTSKREKKKRRSGKRSLPAPPPSPPAIPFERELIVSYDERDLVIADKPRSLAAVVKKLKRLGAFQ